MDGFTIEREGASMRVVFAEGGQEYTRHNTVDRETETETVPVDFVALANKAREFMDGGFVRFRIVMDDYTLVCVKVDDVYRLIGIDGFTGSVDLSEGTDYAPVIAVVMLALAADDYPEAHYLYTIANVAVGHWRSKPMP